MTKRRVLIVLAVVLVLFTGATLRLFVFPGLDPLPDRADAIVELGGPGIRDDAALELARQGKAPFLVQSTTEREAGTNSCLPAPQDVKVLCLHAYDTKAEGQAIAELAREHHWTSVILVTTPDHAWRARLWVRRCFPGEVYVATSPLPGWYWFRQIPYQWGSTVKALVFDRSC
ncbi:hypothetical protein Lesp02_57470 [Lentzea sp. NBRC 105346]|uniref:YdcF family protein n=1 Tax=Lentzea sp. NBRC 105346 TaxID=3032205 RepID=UPI0024A45133|nr:YdcF family protein [Lentzea sp. NBRC 105346]GLZ33559.1 hypothetical protein Lesp02_57470 [Lentzea sp. NBRC 105346]